MKGNKRTLMLAALLLGMACTFLFGTGASAATRKVVSFSRVNSTYYRSMYTAGDYTYYYSKITLPNDGLIRLTGYRNNQYDIQSVLCDSSGKVMDYYTSNTLNGYKGKQQLYGVKKGTYYVRTTTNGYKGSKFVVGILYRYKVTSYGGNSQAGARQIFAGRAATDVVSGKAGAQTSRWWKFYVPEYASSPVRLGLFCNGGQGGFVVTITGPNISGSKRAVVYPKSTGDQNGFSLNMYRRVRTTGGEIRYIAPKPGWYYIQVQKPTSGRYPFSSMEYAVKWQYM